MTQTVLGHSLWFVPPGGETRNKLDRIIGELARKYDAPVFVPHMTLAPDIPFEQYSSDQIGGLVTSLAGQIKPITLKFVAIEGVPDSLYQGLYVRCDLPESLVSAVQIARKALGRDLDNPTFKPHISICYKQELPQDEKLKIIDQYTSELIGITFDVEGIQIWTNGEPIENWRQVGEEIKLG